MDELYNLWNFSDLAIGEKDLPKSIFKEYGERISIDTDDILYYSIDSTIDYDIFIHSFYIKKRNSWKVYSPFTIKLDIMSGSSYPCTFIDYYGKIYICNTPDELRERIDLTLDSSNNIDRLVEFFYI